MRVQIGKCPAIWGLHNPVFDWQKCGLLENYLKLAFWVSLFGILLPILSIMSQVIRSPRLLWVDSIVTFPPLLGYTEPVPIFELMTFPIELFYRAYRKAKNEAFRDSNCAHGLKFAAYEEDLAGNLSRLRQRLRRSASWRNDLGFIGGVTCIPKKITPLATIFFVAQIGTFLNLART